MFRKHTVLRADYTLTDYDSLYGWIYLTIYLRYLARTHKGSRSHGKPLPNRLGLRISTIVHRLRPVDRSILTEGPSRGHASSIAIPASLAGIAELFPAPAGSAIRSR